MRKMKHIKPIIVAVLFLMVWLPAQAQWAGEDKKVTLNPDESYPTIKIGLPDNSNKHYYTWRGDYIISQDVHQPQIEVQPHDSVTTYHVERLTECGMEEDDVVVRIIDSVSIVRITPKVCCYNSGDPIQTSDFTIETNPPGYEGWVTVSPSEAPYFAFPESTKELTFELSLNGYTSKKTVTLDVYNPTVNASITTDWFDLVNKLSKFEEQTRGFRKFTDGLQDNLRKLKLLAGVGCQPVFNFNFEGGGAGGTSLPSFKYCCKGLETSGVQVEAFSLALNAGFECYLPIPGLSAGASGLLVHLMIQGGTSAGPITSRALKDSRCSEFYIPFSTYIEATGALTVAVWNPNVLSLEGGAIGRASMDWKWIPSEPLEWKPLTLTVTVYGKIKLGNFLEPKISYTLYSARVF